MLPRLEHPRTLDRSLLPPHQHPHPYPSTPPPDPRRAQAHAAARVAARAVAGRASVRYPHRTWRAAACPPATTCTAAVLPAARPGPTAAGPHSHAPKAAADTPSSGAAADSESRRVKQRWRPAMALAAGHPAPMAAHPSSSAAAGRQVLALAVAGRPGRGAALPRRPAQPNQALARRSQLALAMCLPVAAAQRRALAQQVTRLVLAAAVTPSAQAQPALAPARTSRPGWARSQAPAHASRSP